MKASETATRYVLIGAQTNSEWDGCDFAIITITEEWKEQQRERLQLVRPFQGDNCFQSLVYYDTAVGFFRTDDDDQPGLENLLEEKQWVYVELTEEELGKLTVPENRLDCHRLLIRADGTAYYKAYGKHTSEEFWTENFSLDVLCKLSEQPADTQIA